MSVKQMCFFRMENNVFLLLAFTAEYVCPSKQHLGIGFFQTPGWRGRGEGMESTVKTPQKALINLLIPGKRRLSRFVVFY